MNARTLIITYERLKYNANVFAENCILINLTNASQKTDSIQASLKEDCVT